MEICPVHWVSKYGVGLIRRYVNGRLTGFVRGPIQGDQAHLPSLQSIYCPYGMAEF
jgi:hypothetical protein